MGFFKSFGVVINCIVGTGFFGVSNFFNFIFIFLYYFFIINISCSLYVLSYWIAIVFRSYNSFFDFFNIGSSLGLDFFI